MRLHIRLLPANPRRTWHIFAVLLITCWILFLSPAVTASPFPLEVVPKKSTDGVAHLSWEPPEDSQVYLQQSKSKDFPHARILYLGQDTGTTVTGLSNGTYFFRIGSTVGNDTEIAWSEPVTLEVRHHSLIRAFTFFAIGILVFLGILVLVITGSHRHKVDAR